MQCAKNFFGENPADSGNARQLLDSGLFYALQTAEMIQQGPAPARADSRNPLQRGFGCGLLTAAPMARDREAVRLVPDLLNQVGRR